MPYPASRSGASACSGVMSLILRLAAIAMLSLLTPAFSLQAAKASAQAVVSPVTLSDTVILRWTEPWRGGDDSYAGITLFDDGGVKVHVLTFHIPGDASPEELLESESLRPNGWEDAASGIDTGGGYYYMAVGMRRGQAQDLNYTRGWYDETSERAIMVHVQTPIGRFQDVLTSIPQTITLNELPLYGDLNFEEVVSTFEAGAGFDIPGPYGAGVPEPRAQVEEPEEAAVKEATLVSANVLGWQEPWHLRYEANPEDVLLVNPENASLRVMVYPASEHTPESAVMTNMTFTDTDTVIASGAEADGSFTHFRWVTINGETDVDYDRAWSSSDGLWIIHVSIWTNLIYFHRDLQSIPESVRLDGAPLWADLDADAMALAVQESSGIEVPTNVLAGGEFTSVNGTVFGYTGDWVPDTSMEAPEGVTLLAGDAMVVLGDFAEEQDPEALFNSVFESLPKADEGPTPDGGYYGLGYGQDVGGRDFFMLFRFLLAEGTGTPVIFLMSAPAEGFPDSLRLAHGVTVNGQPVLEGLDDAALLATYQNGGPTGAPIFTGGQASQPASTEAPAEPPVATGNEITGPAGTLFSWSDAWSYQQLEGMPPSAVILYGLEVPATVMIFEGVAGQDVDTFWAEYSSTGGEIIDEGQSPDGGYYEVSYNEASGSPVGSTTPSYTLTRAYESGSVPVLVSVIINGEDFQASLVAAREVTANGTSILDGVDDAALIATFENGGPTGVAIFTGGEASAPERESGSGDWSEGVASPRDILANVPVGLPEGNPERDQAQEDGNPSTYTSEMFGYTLAWEASWIPYEDVSDINEADGYEIFALQADGTWTGAFSLFAAAWDTDLEARDYVEYWASDEFVLENFPEGTEVVLADSRRNSGAVVYVGPQDENDPELWVTIYEVVNVDDEIRLEPTLVAPLSDFEGLYDDAQASVTLDDDEVIGFFSTEEIVAALP